MKELTLYFEYCDWIGIDIDEYLSTLDGVEEVKIDVDAGSIYVKYDSLKISAVVIKYEILFCIDELRIPLLIGFDKHGKEVEHYTMNVEDICCEFCFKGLIDDLFTMSGINSATSDFDFHNMFNVHINITYDKSVIKQEKILELEQQLNKKN